MDLQRFDSYQGGAGPDFNEHVLHKTILVGDSGVGKTSLLVQFDQGKFIPGSFSATVGIGFTCTPTLKRSTAQDQGVAASPGPHTQGHLLIAGWLGSGAACWPHCAATAENLAPVCGSQRCHTFRSRHGVSGDRFPWELNPDGWRLWRTSPRDGFGPCPQSRRPAPAHLWSGDMTGTPGAAATQDGEAPELSPPCNPSYDLTLKVMLLGDSGVGKTCFLIRFKDGAFLSGTFIATVGIDFRNKVVTVDGVRVKLQIWDTAGQERFRSVTHAYYRDAQALLLLYDITNKSSFENIRAWLTEIHEYAQRDVVIMLLGNKADVSSERVIRSEDGERLAREYGVPFMETSAKTGMNVELAFLAIAKELKYRAGQQADEPSFQIRDYVESQKKRPSCCSFL